MIHLYTASLWKGATNPLLLSTIDSSVSRVHVSRDVHTHTHTHLLSALILLLNEGKVWTDGFGEDLDHTKSAHFCTHSIMSCWGGRERGRGSSEEDKLRWAFFHSEFFRSPCRAPVSLLLQQWKGWRCSKSGVLGYKEKAFVCGQASLDMYCWF